MPNPIGRSGHFSQTYQSERQRSSPAREARVNRGSANPASPPAGQFQGSTAGVRSREEAVLEVRTADGDTVRISLRAALQAQATVGSAQVDGASAGAQSLTGTSSYQVRVDVKGTLSDEETTQIGDLLERLVTAARSGAATASPPAATAPSRLDGYQFAYRAYQQNAQSSLLY